MRAIAEVADIQKNSQSLLSPVHPPSALTANVNGSDTRTVDEVLLPPPSQPPVEVAEKLSEVIPPPEEFAPSEHKPTGPPVEELKVERVLAPQRIMGSRESLESEEEVRGRKQYSRSPSGSPQVSSSRV